VSQGDTQLLIFSAEIGDSNAGLRLSLITAIGSTEFIWLKMMTNVDIYAR
jgi:hypothetical protein